MILFLCTHEKAHVLTWAKDREDAKKKAQQWLWHDADRYIVTPLTAPGDRINLNITLAV